MKIENILELKDEISKYESITLYGIKKNEKTTQLEVSAELIVSLLDAFQIPESEKKDKPSKKHDQKKTDQLIDLAIHPLEVSMPSIEKLISDAENKTKNK